MKRASMIALLLLLALPAAGFCEEKEGEKEGVKEQSRFVAGNNEFAINLYAALSWKDGNIVFSPYSVSTALAMVYAGACGETEKEMAGVLRFGLPQEFLHKAFKESARDLKDMETKFGCRFSIANSLWKQKGEAFLKDYLALVQENYGAATEETDFQTPESRKKTCEAVNAWIADNTSKKITELFRPDALDAQTLLVLANTVYFKGQWKTPFDTAKTKDGDFTIAPGKTVSVPMMDLTAQLQIIGTVDMQIMEIPYDGESLSMVVVLPCGSRGISECEKDVTNENLMAWLKEMRTEKMRLRMPRFSAATSFNLKEVLSFMGMAGLFTERKADLSGMVETRGIWVSDVLHGACIDVNEQGTEAAAATVVKVKKNGDELLCVNVDRPFLFLILHRQSRAILFAGRITDPTAGQKEADQKPAEDSSAPKSDEPKPDVASQEHASLKAYPTAVISATDPDSGATVEVDKDGRTVACKRTKGGVAVPLWRVDIIEACGAPAVGQPVVRDVSIKDGKVSIVYGKHNFATLDLKTGGILTQGAD